jgi:hypothetical protein
MAPGLLISAQKTPGFRGFQRPILATPECVQLSGFWTGVSGVLIRETVLKIRRIHQVDGLSINAIANVAVPDSSSKTCSAGLSRAYDSVQRFVRDHKKEPAKTAVRGWRGLSV